MSREVMLERSECHGCLCEVSVMSCVWSVEGLTLACHCYLTIGEYEDG